MYGFFVRRDGKSGHCRKVAIRGGSTVIIARVQNSKVCPRISIENYSKAWEGNPKEVYYSSLNAACKESGVQ